MLMKKILSIFLCSVALLFISAGKKQKTEVPPGTVVVNDTLFADETEISNFSWLEYVEYNKRKYGATSREYISTLPDTLVWRQKMSFNEAYVDYYFRHVAYRDYPVVGVSYEQAKNYCVWRSERVNYMLNVKKGKQINHVDSVFRGKPIYEYRLPTKQEWEALALIGLDEKKYKTKPIVTANLIRKEKIANAQAYEYADITAPVQSYWPNKLGMFNLKGNVSEMILDKGVAKGGSWQDAEEIVFLLNDFQYTKPTANIGFRCVCVKK